MKAARAAFMFFYQKSIKRSNYSLSLFYSSKKISDCKQKQF